VADREGVADQELEGEGDGKHMGIAIPLQPSVAPLGGKLIIAFLKLPPALPPA